MKKLGRLVILLAGILFLAVPLKAQSDSLYLNPKIDIVQMLPALDSLVEIARRVNPVFAQKHKNGEEFMELKIRLAKYYADLIGYDRIFKGRNEDFLMQQVACQIAEKEYREGVIRITEYSRQKKILADAEAEYNDAFRLYLGALVQFEAILGVPLHKVMLKPKKN